ncbi:MAG: SsrA-binding protein SmpB [Bacteroidota bacterium]|nr:SsrA-binding protein SmpB [Bacteroidota bacterium]MDX5506001.1 SsrA-binding protein SmpB [Bacteroidota bacterium]
MSKSIEIKNRKARFQYEILETFVAGIQLRGTEIKSIRDAKASLDEAYCHFVDGELFIRSMTIAEYSHGNIYNHEPTRERKLLLKKKELEKLEKKLKDQGNTVVPLKLFINDKGLAKLQIGLARGKKLHDKRESIKEKDMKRDVARIKARF